MGVANIACPVILPSASSFFVRHLSEYVGLWPHLYPSPPAPASGLARAPCPHPLRILISLFGLLSINKAPRPVQHARIVPSRFSHHAIGHLLFLPQNFTCFCRKYHLFLTQNVPCFYRKYFPFLPFCNILEIILFTKAPPTPLQPLSIFSRLFPLLHGIMKTCCRLVPNQLPPSSIPPSSWRPPSSSLYVVIVFFIQHELFRTRATSGVFSNSPTYFPLLFILNLLPVDDGQCGKR